MIFEVVVRKIVEQAVVVESDNAAHAEYLASCQAGDNDTEQILNTGSVTEISL